MWRDRINKDAVDRLLLRAEGETGLVPFVGAGLSLPWTSLGWAAFLNNIARAGWAGQVSGDLAAGRYEEAAERIQRTAGRAMFNSAIYDAFGDHNLARPTRWRRTAMAILPRLATGPVVTTNLIECWSRPSPRS
jgi:aminoglycoside phosphotransferase (APT) family kinase protein